MSGIVRYNALDPMMSYIDAPDTIFGTGVDGNITISSNTTLTSDVFYNNLTINAGINLITAGYRVFVRNVLTMGNGSLIGFTTGSTAAGTIMGGGATATAVTNSLGGSSATTTATVPHATAGGLAYWSQPWNSVRGYSITATQTTPLMLRGGAGGISGPGGGVVIVSARYISIDTSASLSAPGFGGSGGGGGGVIFLITSHSTTPASLVTNVAGGTGCSAGSFYRLQVS
jgi:hypothetical protein